MILLGRQQLIAEARDFNSGLFPPTLRFKNGDAGLHRSTMVPCRTVAAFFFKDSDALRSRQKVSLQYLKADGEEISTRVIRPYSFVISSGAWYVIAYCELTECLRIFRLDRIAGVSRTEDEYDVPESFSVSDVVRNHKALSPRTSDTMMVRYSPRIAPWIAEREEGELGDDGSFVVHHPLADQDWAVRHVLQYGAEAEVLEPASMRQAVTQRLTRAASMLAGA